MLLPEGITIYNDSENIPPEERIASAVARFEKKRGETPTICYVNPGVAGLDHVRAELARLGIEITIIATPNVLPYHFHIVKNGNGHGKVTRING